MLLPVACGDDGSNGTTTLEAGTGDAGSDDESTSTPTGTLTAVPNDPVDDDSSGDTDDGPTTPPPGTDSNAGDEVADPETEDTLPDEADASSPGEDGADAAFPPVTEVDAGDASSPAGIEWTPLEVDFEGRELETGVVQVPVDYTRPDGEQLTLAVLRARVPSEKRTGVLMFNGGGPGPGTIVDADYLLEELVQIAPTQDIVLVDNRGTGYSTPIDCLPFPPTSTEPGDAGVASDSSDGESSDGGSVSGSTNDSLADAGISLDSGQEAAIRVDGGSIDAGGFDVSPWIDVMLDFRDDTQALAAACTERHGEQLRYFNSENVARDMDAVRRLLGAEKLNYWGVSYGTMQGALYAKLFPQSVGAFVLDSPVLRTATGPDYVDVVLQGAVEYETQLNRFFEWADANGTSALYGREGGSAALFDSLDAQLSAGVETDDGVLDSFLLIGLARQLLRWGEWELFATGMADASEGDWTLLSELSGLENIGGQQDIESFRAGQANEMLNLMEYGCRSNFGIDEALELYFSVANENPRLGIYSAFGIANCLDWTLEPAEPRIVPSDVASAPLLVMGALNDPATPYANAVALVEQLDNGSKLLTANNEGHGVGDRSSCGLAALSGFLVSAEVEGAPAECSVEVAASRLRHSASRAIDRLAAQRRGIRR